MEFYEDLYIQREDLERRLEDPDNSFEERQALRKNIVGLNKALGEEEIIEDDLIDQWEKDLEEGRMPDLDAK